MDYDAVVQYLIRGVYPAEATKKRKRALRKQSQRFAISNGRLVLKTDPSVSVARNEEQKTEILKIYHDQKGHFGGKKCYYAIRQMWFWDKMYKEIQEYVRSCTICQKINPCGFNITTELHPIRAKETFHQIEIDLIEMPLSSSCSKFVLTGVDIFSKFAFARALPDKSANSVVAALKDIFFMIGFPCILSHDQGKEFNNASVDKFLKQYEVKQKVSSAYHPQSQGLVKRFNQTLKRALLKQVGEDQSSWEMFLSETVYHYNTAVQESTKVAPYTVVFHRNAAKDNKQITKYGFSFHEKIREI